MDSYLIFLSGAAVVGAGASVIGLFEAWKDRRAQHQAEEPNSLQMKVADTGFVGHAIITTVMLTLLSLMILVIALDPGEVRGLIVRVLSASVICGLGIWSVYDLHSRRAVLGAIEEKKPEPT